MQEAHERSIEVKELLLKKLKQDKVASPMEILRIVQKYGDNVERAIETASKLAPYYHPKLEAIEVKSEVQHKFVIRAPNQIANVDEWIKQTGAQRLKIEQHVNDRDAKPQEGETQLGSCRCLSSGAFAVFTRANKELSHGPDTRRSRRDFPKTATEFEERFATEEDCRAYWIEARWGGEPACARCGSKRVWTIRAGSTFARVASALTAGWSTRTAPDESTAVDAVLM